MKRHDEELDSYPPRSRIERICDRAFPWAIWVALAIMLILIFSGSLSA